MAGSLTILAAAVILRFGLPMRGRAPALASAAVPDLSAITRLAADPNCLPGDATVLASWHFATPLWMAGWRDRSTAAAATDAPYVTASGAPIVYVHPDFATGEPIGETWRKRTDSAARRGPVLLTNRTAEVMAEDAPLAPSIGDPFWRRGGKPEQRLACAPEPPDGVWIPMLATLGSPPNEWRIGDGFVNWGEDALIVRLSASTDRGATANDVVAFAQLYDVDVAAVVGQADRPLGHAELQDDGRSRAFAIRLPITPNRAFEPTHRLAVDVGLYRLGRDGAAKRMAVESVLFDTLDGPRTMLPYAPAEGAEIVDGSAARLIVLGPSVPSLSRYRLPAPPPGAVPFGAAMSLLRSTVHRTPTALFVDLTWRADPLAPLSDYTISVQAAADDASWHAQHDGTPALGAIPTLKWLSGMVIHDRHRIPLPLEAAGQDGPFTVTVGVYDAFSLEPLPVTDGDLVRQGQGQRAIIYPSP